MNLDTSSTINYNNNNNIHRSSSSNDNEKGDKKTKNHHPQYEQVVDVIVIGAGVAGLAAAQHFLHQPSTPTSSVIVLEARNRSGGRVHTVPLVVDPSSSSSGASHQSYFVDMGATWVHGNSPRQPIVKIARKLDYNIMTLITEKDNGISVYDIQQGKRIPQRTLDKAYKSYWKIIRRAQNYAKSSLLRSISIADAVRHVQPDALQDPILQHFFANGVEFDYGGSLDTVDTLGYDEDDEYPGGDAVPVPKGYQPIIDELTKGLEIHYAQPVSSIEYDAKTGGVVVTTTTTTSCHDSSSICYYRAKKVICTLPLGVLKSQDVLFSPPLSQQKQDAISRLGWGTVNKIVLLFNDVFWPPKEQGFGIAALHQTFSYILNKFAFTQDPILEIYAVGSHAIHMDSQDEATILSDVLKCLSDMFRIDVSELESNLVEYRLGRWAKEVYTRGAYSYISTETKRGDYDSFQRAELNNTLFFAGEHTIGEYRGTVHGAYLSGKRAAEQVIKLLV